MLSIHEQKIIKDFYNFLETSIVGSFDTYKYNSTISAIFEREPEAIDTEKVEAHRIEKKHKIYEYIASKMMKGEKIDVPPRLIEILLESLNNNQFKLGPKVKINIDVTPVDNRERLKFEQEKPAL
jgi:hypothetical protein